MYDAVADPCCYPGTTVLRNIPGLRDQASLDEFEAAITSQRADEPPPRGRPTATHLFEGLKRKRHLRDLSGESFAAEAAAFLSTLNAIHPFREGNGRTQTTFLALLAEHAGHPVDLDQLNPESFLTAMVKSFKGNDRPLERQILKLIGR